MMTSQIKLAVGLPGSGSPAAGHGGAPGWLVGGFRVTGDVIKGVVLTLAYLIRHPELALAAVPALVLFRWAVLPHARAPHFRVQNLKLRMYMHLHPGRGFATILDVFLNWNRWASYRESKRTRPATSSWRRMRNADLHSIFLGRVQYFLGMRLPIQEHLVMFGPPRAYKSGFFAHAITNYQGAIVSTSTKGDMLGLTGGVRQRRGSPVYTFNPQRLGGRKARSNIRWNLVAGCRVPATAIRRAQALCEAASTEGTEDATFWAEQASMQMRALLCAADLMGRDFRIVNHWILSGQTQQAEKKLIEAGYQTWAAALQQMRSGKAERTTATIRLVLSSAVAFMSDPTLAECVIPGPGDAFDIERFLAESGSLYLIGEMRGKTSPIAPLFCGLVTEIHYIASQVAASAKGARLDPPLLLALDEVTQIVPIPLPSIVADSGGRGIQLIIAAHGIAQLRTRWGNDGARAILDCCNLMINPGVQDPDTLELAEKLAGKEYFKIKHGEQRQQLPIAPLEAIRQLPKKRSLLIRTRFAPAVTRLPMGWRDWGYLRARMGGYAEAALAEMPSLAGSGHAPVLVDAVVEDEIEQPQPGQSVPQPLFIPPQASNGNGHSDAGGLANGNGQTHSDGHMPLNGDGHVNGNGHHQPARDPWGEEL